MKKNYIKPQVRVTVSDCESLLATESITYDPTQKTNYTLSKESYFDEDDFDEE